MGGYRIKVSDTKLKNDEVTRITKQMQDESKIVSFIARAAVTGPAVEGCIGAAPRAARGLEGLPHKAASQAQLWLARRRGHARK